MGSKSQSNQTFLGQERYLEKEFEGSSLVKKIHYDSLMQRLQIFLNNGYAYEYSAVPEDVLLELCNATSVGQYFTRIISRNYKFKRIDDYNKDNK